MNRNFLIVSATSLMLLTISISALRKVAPISISSLASHCQNLTSSFSFHLPHLIWPLFSILVIATLMITAIKLCASLLKIHQLTKVLSGSLIAKEKFGRLAEKVGLKGRAVLVEDDHAFAFCLGLLSPKVYLSTKMMRLATEKELEVILHHEKYHLDNRDTLTLLLAYISKSLFPFFPLLGDFVRNFRIEKEIKADREAVTGFGDKGHLVNALRKLLSEPPFELAFLPQVSDLDSLEIRIKALVSDRVDFRRRYGLFGIVISIISVAILAGVTLGPVQAMELHDQDQDVVLVCVSQTLATPVDRSTR